MKRFAQIGIVMLTFFVFFLLGAGLSRPGVSFLSFMFTPSMAATASAPKVSVVLPTGPEVLFMPSMSAVSYKEPPAPTPAPTEAPAPTMPPTPAGQITVVRGNTQAMGIHINNETTYDLSGISPAQGSGVRADGPQVLIVHTHTSEAYTPSEAYNYVPTDVDRTEDTAYNVARVGLELKNALEGEGISVLYDPQLNDYPSYNGSYKKSMDLITWYLNEYPTIEYVFDVHRDAIVQSDGTKLATVCQIDGQSAAQVMLVVGTDAGGLYNPDWQKNLAVAAAIQKKLNDTHENFARPLNLRKERFNGHLSPGHMIIEVGTTGNTLDQALVSARALGECIGEYIKSEE